MFYALSTNEDSIASKVNLFIAHAPVVRFKNAPWKIQIAKMLQNPIEGLFGKYKISSLFGVNFIETLKQIENDTILGSFIHAIASAVIGNPAFNSAKWSQISGSWSPARCSVRQMLHFAKMIKSGVF